MLFYLGTNKNSEDFTWICGEAYAFGYQLNPHYWMHFHLVDENRFRFFSEQAIGRKENGELFRPFLADNYLGTIENAQNNFVGLEFRKTKTDFEFWANSARITRARLYFTIHREGIYFSPDLRALLPYSSRKLKPDSAYSILKYGDVPEYLTIVDDIFCIPVGRYLKLNEKDLKEILKRQKIDLAAFRPFFHLSFPMDGGDVAATYKLLQSNFEFLSKNNPLVPVSGGVDSTLINCLVNEFSESAYPAYYMQFGKDDPEVSFARKAVEGTKAELVIDLMHADDTIEAFEFQNEKLIQPIGESSTIAIAHFFRKMKFEKRYVLDGTLADGCYGSCNYNVPLFGNQKERSLAMQKATEHLATWMKVRNTSGNEHFYPRDTNMPDKMMQFMHMYLGPFANTWFKKAREYSEELLPFWRLYYEFLDAENGRNDDWARYSVFKMVNYACKNNTAKTYDNSQPENSAFYAFTWLDVLKDQGHYSWAEKTKDNTIKYVLKKILENYKPKEFIYRKKVGLNSSFNDWIHLEKNRTYFADLLAEKSGITGFFLGGKRQNFLVKKFQQEVLQENLANLVINLAILQGWLNRNNITIG